MDSIEEMLSEPSVPKSVEEVKIGREGYEGNAVGIGN
jgi:hypothetical protein